MTSIIDDDEITYGPRKLRAKDWLTILAFFALGSGMLMWGLNEQSHGGLEGWRAYKMIFAGGILVLAMIAGTIYRISGVMNNTPRVTMLATGITYVLSSRAVFEADWDSVGHFEMVHDARGRVKAIRAQVTGPNVSETVQRDNRFSISFLKLLDVEPAQLVHEINQVRTTALTRQS